MRAAKAILFSVGLFETEADGAPQYDGECFIDSAPPNRIWQEALDEEVYINSDEVAPAMCRTYCQEEGFKYFGLQAYNWCFCGDNDPSTDILTDSAECNRACAGDDESICGATWRMNIFTIEPPVECPNDGWEANTDGTECVPVPNSMSIACNADSMTVTLKASHLYVDLGEGYEDALESAAFVGTCSTRLVQSSSGIYTVSIPLDACGTEVSQANGVITFANTIYGSDDAISVDGIIITEKLQLDVACTYTDSFDITVSEITVEEGTHLTHGTSDTGDFSAQFVLKSYIDDGYSIESSTSNPVIIGSRVYNRISVSGSIPSNVAYIVTDCDAQDSATSPALIYEIIQDGCLDKLTSATEESLFLRGSSSTTIDFSFNGFTFESSSDTLYVKCTIEICALNMDGTFVDSTCGFHYGDDDCVDATSTMGLMKATAVDLSEQ